MPLWGSSPGGHHSTAQHSTPCVRSLQATKLCCQPHLRPSACIPSAGTLLQAQKHAAASCEPRCTQQCSLRIAAALPQESKHPLHAPAAQPTTLPTTLPTIYIIDCEGGTKVAEDAGEDTTGLNPDEGDGWLVGMAHLVDALALLQTGICQDHHLQACIRKGVDSRSRGLLLCCGDHQYDQLSAGGSGSCCVLAAARFAPGTAPGSLA